MEVLEPAKSAQAAKFRLQCDTYRTAGIEPIVRCLAATDETLREEARTLLVTLATANRQFASNIQRAVLLYFHHSQPGTQRAAAMLLRELEDEIPPTPEYVALGKVLLRSSNVQVRHEGGALLRMLAARDELRRAVMAALVESLAPSVSVIAEVTRAECTLVKTVLCLSHTRCMQ
jgi:hypothetical protein